MKENKLGLNKGGRPPLALAFSIASLSVVAFVTTSVELRLGPHYHELKLAV